MKVYGVKDIHGKDGYRFYKKNYDTNVKYKARTYEEWALIHREIWKEVANQILEAEGGVYITKFGYIVMVMTPFRKPVYKIHSRKASYRYYNDHSDNKVYTINYFNKLVKNNKFRYWTLDKSFTRTIKTGLKKELLKGKKYQLKYTLLKKIYLGTETITKQIKEERKLNENR